jgi:microcystin-dependent protein
MADPFIGEIRVFPFDYVPAGWVNCNGQTLQIRQYQALYAVLGVVYGGDGQNTFAVPNLGGCAALQTGQGPNLTNRPLASTGGSATVTLTSPQMPMHNHALQGNSNDTVATASATPASTTVFGKAFVKGPTTAYLAVNAQPILTMSQATVTPAGSSQPHNNLPPYLVLNFCMAIEGVYPSPE